MSADKSTSWSYAEDLPAEDEVLIHARERSFELGVTPIGPGVGAVLTVLAAASKAQTAVEIGTGAGVSGVCILRGLGPNAVLTTIDVDVEHLKAAREAFQEAGQPDPHDFRPCWRRPSAADRQRLRPGLHRRRQAQLPRLRRTGGPAAQARRAVGAQ
jgi:hypothetical protein